MKISKAVIPVAGLGTRMLPATKEVPKELMPILDKPLIQHVVNEAASSGIKEIIFVTRPGKKSVTKYFSINQELESYLIKKKKSTIKRKLPNKIFKNIQFFSVVQKEPLGLGHAILSSQKIIKDEPFVVLLPDELLISKTKMLDLKLMINNFKNFKKYQILVEKVSKKLISNYGVVDLKKSDLTFTRPSLIKDIIEKPKANLAPSNKRVIGRYLLPGSIFKYLKKVKPGKDNEIQLTDAIKKMIFEEDNCFQATLSNSIVYDCGSVKGFIGANIAMAMKGKSLKKYLKEIIN